MELPKAESPQRNPLQGFIMASGADRDRTGDPLLAKQVLSQLSYRPEETTALQVSNLSGPPQVKPRKLGTRRLVARAGPRHG